LLSEIDFAYAKIYLFHRYIAGHSMIKGFANFDSFMIFPFDFTTPEIKGTQNPS